MKGSRISAVAIVVGATAWIASGYLMPHESAESRAAVQPVQTETKLFRVSVTPSERIAHRQRLVLSGRTEADRKVTLTARTGGTLTDLRVRRGSVVKAGDIVAVLSDDARAAQLAQARAVATQRRTEYEAKSRLIANGTTPKLEAWNLEAQVKIAEAQLAAAQAEFDRGVVRAPWDGLITDLAVEVGGAAFSFAGKDLATLVALDPMLAVAEVAERKLAGINVGDSAEVRLANGQTAQGRVRFVSKTASATTRTYRVEVEMANRDGAIPDGITAEVSVLLAPAQATRVPRSALVFSSAGDLGVRVVEEGGKVAFAPVTIVEDEQASMWVAGLADGAKVIVEGQDFVRDGQVVDAVVTADRKTATR